MKHLKWICIMGCLIGTMIWPTKAFASPNPSDGNTALAGSSNTLDSAGPSGQTGQNQESPQTGETIRFTPKMIVECCRFSDLKVQAGDEVTVTFVLKNTSKTEILRNMTVTVTEQGEYLSLLSATDTTYIDTVLAGGNCEVSYVYKVQAATPEGQYVFDVAMDYADSKGSVYTANGKARMQIEQPVRLEIDDVSISSEVQVADVINVKAQAMNLGRSKIYNVRAVIEAEGMSPEGTLFIGDLEPGTTGNGEVGVSIIGLSGTNTPYGNAEGTMTFYYEDESGNAYEEVKKISTYIAAPFLAEETVEKEPDQTGQWWIIMTIICTALMLISAMIVLRIMKRRRT